MGIRIPRRAFTLIELLVVIGIIIVLAAIALAFLPSRQSRLASQAADQVQTALASARSKALHDQTICGVRFYSPDDGQTFTSYQIVERPEEYCPCVGNALGSVYIVYQPVNLGNPPNVNQPYQLTLFGVNPSGYVQPGDYFENYDVPGPLQSQRVIAVNGATITLSTIPPAAVAITAQTKQYLNFHFVRQPRPLMGEPGFNLPVNATILANGNAAPSSYNIPQNYNGQYEIQFNPAGQVVNATSGRIVLWFSDVNNASKPTLLTVYARTGAVASHPVNLDKNLPSPNAYDPYWFTRDGQSSGQ
jgi:prepilin-type N-terminal cleavage/methylation domain-containing protein